jgi:HlyD family secretion protein
VRRTLGAVLLVAAAACQHKQQAPTVQTATVARRDVIIDAQANGVIEPIAIIEVKSKASGVITRMPVETGTRLNRGDLIVQIDTRDVQNKYDQAKASLDAAEAKLAVTESDKKRNEEMFKQRVITPQEYEQIAVNYETAKSNVVSARANLDIAKQALEDATVKAPAEGTVIDKPVAEGTVIASANGSVSGGTTIIHMADLGVVRIRALFNESDIGNIHPGEPANVTVDAYPDRRFTGNVEKIEPQAVVQQNVTMFPVLVNLDNAEALLKQGMNGSIAVLIDERDNVLAIPNDAIKNPREAVATGAMLGMSADSIQNELKAQGFNFGGNRGGFGGGRRQGGGGAANRGRNGPQGTTDGTASGEVSLASQGPQGGFGQQATDADCKKIDDVLKAHPKEKKQLDDLAAKMAALRPAGFGNGNGGGFRRNRAPGDSTRRRGSGNPGAGADSTRRGGRGNPEMMEISQQMRAIYTTLDIDARMAGACRRRAAGNAGNAGMQAGRQSGGNRQLTPSTEMNGRPQRPRTGVVFVTDSAKKVFHPRIVQLGAGNLDYTEVTGGLKEGERVVMLGALAMQAQRQQQQDRIRQNASPLGGQQGPRGGGGRGR